MRSRTSASRAAVNAFGSAANSSSSRASRSKSGIRLGVQPGLALRRYASRSSPSRRSSSRTSSAVSTRNARDSIASATRVPATWASTTGRCGARSGSCSPTGAHVLHDVRHHAGRGKARDADAVRTEIHEELLRQHHHRRLARRVGRAVVRVDDDAVSRRGVDDVAVALLDQHRQEHLVAPHDAEQVHVEQASTTPRRGSARAVRRPSCRRCSPPRRPGRSRRGTASGRRRNRPAR